MSSFKMPYDTDVPFNDTGLSEKSRLTDNLNSPYQTGDIAWMLVSTALVLLMIPGVGFFYSGLARRKSALSMLWISMMAVAVVSLEWFLWGYSLTFSHSAGLFLGNLANLGFKDVLARPSVGSARVPDLLFAVYEGMFAAITVAIATSAISDRGRMLPCLIFMFVWSTVGYSPVAAWTWNPQGWVYKLGGLDFAGGTVVHISAGAAALAYSYALGKRCEFGTQKLNYRPQNITHVVLGTAFLWVGWFGFNAGSALSANLRAVMAAVVTNLAACMGGITWCLVDYRLEKKWSTVGFCSGVVAGLVAITPGSGYVPAWAGVVFGVCAGLLCNFATQLKHSLHADDSFDIFAVHALGGLLGDILTGIFAADYIAHLDGFTVIPGGWINGHWIQVAIQLGDAVSGMAWSFLVSYSILTFMSILGRYIPALRLRVSREEEELGIDDVEMGEFAYDYVDTNRGSTPAVSRNEDAPAESNSLSNRFTLAHPEKEDNTQPAQPKRWTSLEDSYPRYL